MKIENITIIGSGYVGLALAISLSSKYHVSVHDIDEKKVKKLNQGQSPLDDNEFLKEFKNNNPQIFATTSIGDALKNTQLIFVCVPTNFDEQKQNTSNEQISDTDSETIEVNDNDKAEDDSIESIPFIAEPSKEKRTRSTK